MSPRFKALEVAGERAGVNGSGNRDVEQKTSAEWFGTRVFSRQIMEKVLPQEVYLNVVKAMEGIENIRPEYANQIAVAVKEWAVSHGATHYTHWFQPWTGTPAEKHDSFIDWKADGGIIDRFDGKQLVQGEPDASSFPSGGLRTTNEARGYTGWDPTSAMFLWKAGDGITLCIPSLFFSWTGDVLDNKIPLLRSDQLINRSVLRLLKLTGKEAQQVFSMLGWEQEYFVVDRALRNRRPDLVLLGKTVYGAPPPKGQELQDHYFGVVKDRILSFMKDFETVALQLGIPVKTRHNEVAPAQHEVACTHEKASTAVDHNILIMELMRQVAHQHGLACLLHEKPFAGLNGSGKHNNWSIATDTGVNLLDPTDYPENHFEFLVLLTAILAGVHEHATLLRAAIGTAANDDRLGGHEAPPAIISVYLGEALEEFLKNIEKKGAHTSKGSKVEYNLGVPVVPKLCKDDSDRNRTSPLAFTGAKFEFRAVGSSASCAMPITIINMIAAEALDKILDEVEENLGEEKTPSRERLLEAALPVIQKHLKKSRKIRFSGDNYDQKWVEEAEKRKLPNIENSLYAYDVFRSKKTEKLFEGVLSKEELDGRYEVLVDTYAKHMNIEANLMVNLLRSQVLPAAIKHQKTFAESIKLAKEVSGLPQEFHHQQDLLSRLITLIGESISLVDELERLRWKASLVEGDDRVHAYADVVRPKMKQVREVVDELECLIDDRLWPLPKYWELLSFV